MSDVGVRYSVRMRATDGQTHEVGRHLSGGERLVEASDVDSVVAMLTARAIAAGAAPDAILVSVDPIAADTISTIPALPITTVDALDCEEAVGVASAILSNVGVSGRVITDAFRALTDGPLLSGAAIVDCRDGRRMDSDLRGVRLTRLDYTSDARAFLDSGLIAGRIPHQRTVDALAIATKAIWSGVTAELCWSDDVRYVAGYVATQLHGYVRFPQFKPQRATGGRVLFVQWGPSDAVGRIERLRRDPVLIASPIIISPSMSPKSYREQL